MSVINIRGARTHNLKNIDVEIPRDQLVVITGLSGSGKSSLAFDTLYAEGQRRYVESLSSYARQFLSMMEKPDVDSIDGLSPAISIEQKSTSHNPRSTVGTVTEIYDYLRLLYAKVGQPRCPKHHHILEAQSVTQMVDHALSLPEGTKIAIIAPLIVERKGEHLELLSELREKGFVRIRLDGEVYELDSVPKIDAKKKHSLELMVDRLKIHFDMRLRLAESFETALNMSKGIAGIIWLDEPKRAPKIFSAKFSCPDCGYNLPELSPRLFSFNNPQGACGQCDGLGVLEKFDVKLLVNETLSLQEGAIRGWDKKHPYAYQMLQSLAKTFSFALDKPFSQLTKKIQNLILNGSNEVIRYQLKDHEGQRYTKTGPFEGVIPNLERRYRETQSNYVREELKQYLVSRVCDQCKGSRLNEYANHVFVEKHALPELTSWSLQKTFQFFKDIKLSGFRGEIAKKIIKEIHARLVFLMDVGLDYLSLDRTANTLSGGEAQRIRLASQIGSGLMGVMYVLDEPSIGLHQRDNERLLNTLHRLRNLGNTVIVVEHDEEAILHADHVIDMGPRAGVHGGEVVVSGSPKAIMAHPDSLTGQYLSGKRKITMPTPRKITKSDPFLKIVGAKGNNLKNISVNVPLGALTCVTGVSGSGKSTLINDTLVPVVMHQLNRAQLKEVAPHDKIEGLDYFDKAVAIDQSPIGRTPRSNPATYTGLFALIRDLFAQTQEAKSRGYQAGRFSFNVKGGRCETCEGEGLIKVEMHFLSDVYVTCDICQGKRYNRETLEIFFKGKNIAQVLEMTVEDAMSFFGSLAPVKRKLKTLLDVGLSYISLGQSATTLSGGEAQRIKLAKELSRRDTGKTLYILDEPTTGLHFYDIEQLLSVLQVLRDHGNTIIVIEHNLDVIKTADWIIDLGPEGGDGGGEVIYQGDLQGIVKQKKSHTGKFLKKVVGV